MKRWTTSWSLLVALLAGASPAAAHDFWIEPSTFRPAVGERVSLQLRVGEGLAGDALPRDAAQVVRFVALDAEGERSVPGVAGVAPAGVLEVRAEGATLIGYQSRGGVSEMSAETMARYVEEEGLAGQLPAGWRPHPAADAYSRSVKALVAVEGGGAAGFDRRLGLPLELVPETDPTRLVAGGDLPLLLLAEGEPLAGVVVTALSWADPSRPVRATTDRAGRVVLPLPAGGRWLVKAVRLTAAPAGTREDYRSVWTSLTFEAAD